MQEMRDFYDQQTKNFNANIQRMEQQMQQLNGELKLKDDRIDYL